MALVLNQEQALLKESVKDFLNLKSPIGSFRALRDSKDPLGYSPSVWKEMADLGLSSITIAEEFGGLDFGYVALGQALEETGRTLTSSPLISTALLGTTALNLVATKDQKAEIFPGVISGETILALAHEEGSHHRPNNIETTATISGKKVVLNGNKKFVLDGQIANKIIVVAKSNEGIILALVESGAEGMTLNKVNALDCRNTSNISFNNVSSTLLGNGPIDQKDLLRIYDIGAIGIAAEMLGTCIEPFEQTIAYLKERKQFGVSIGSFQALQHRAATMFIEIELCKSVIIKALTTIDQRDQDLSQLASLAKAKLGKTIKLVTNEAIQMHGGIGMTDELDIGFFIKRARVAQTTFGDYNYHLNRYAKLKGY